MLLYVTFPQRWRGSGFIVQPTHIMPLFHIVSPVEKTNRPLRTALKTRRNSGFICLRIGSIDGRLKGGIWNLQPLQWYNWLRTQQICRVCEGFRLLEKLARDFGVVVLLGFESLPRFSTSTSFRLVLFNPFPSTKTESFCPSNVSCQGCCSLAGQPISDISDIRFRWNLLKIVWGSPTTKIKSKMWHANHQAINKTYWYVQSSPCPHL